MDTDFEKGKGRDIRILQWLNEMEDGKNQEDVCKDHKNVFDKMKVNENECILI